MKSVFTVSMHKAGSSIADLILTQICRSGGYEIDRISTRVMSSPDPEQKIFVRYQRHMKTEGVYYGVARGPYVARMDRIPEFKTIVQVRDPRDCLTSAYFSYATSHVVPADPEKAKEFLERRAQMQEMTIDDYVLDQARNYNKRLRVIGNIIDTHDDLLLLKYEDMVENTEDWLAQISAFLDIPITPKLRRRLGDKIDFRVDTEDTSKHKRQVTPGDHKRKLKPETVEELTDLLRRQLRVFGYRRR